MKEQNALKQVAEMARIADSYVSAWGDEAKVEDATIRHLLASLGYDVTNDETLLQSAEKKSIRKMCLSQYWLSAMVSR
ncbi:hypothetical protein QW180_21490 [Vibrio sinaloensis]|nr:hypothetical protein [Vibrio sinaloensis]